MEIILGLVGLIVMGLAGVWTTAHQAKKRGELAQRLKEREQRDQAMEKTRETISRNTADSGHRARLRDKYTREDDGA